MEFKKTNQIIRKLRKEDRYNVCPRCGKEVYLYMDEDGDYWTGCTECGERGIIYDHNYDSAQNGVDFNRLSWNLWMTNGTFSPEVLDMLSVHHGDYVVTNTKDGYIEFAGQLNETFEFLETQKRFDRQALYLIYTVVNGRLIQLGLSHLVELTIKHYKTEK